MIIFSIQEIGISEKVRIHEETYWFFYYQSGMILFFLQFEDVISMFYQSKNPIFIFLRNLFIKFNLGVIVSFLQHSSAIKNPNIDHSLYKDD